MGTTAINGILQAMTQRVRRQQELIDQLVFDLGTQSLENQALARDILDLRLASIAAFENTEEQVESRSRLLRLRVQPGEKNES